MFIESFLLLTVIKKETVEESPNVKIFDNEIITYSKNNISENNYVDYGAMIFKKDVFNKQKSEDFDLEIIIKRLIIENNIKYTEVKHKFYEMGNLSSFKTLDQMLINNNIKDLWNE